jgi:hypothetical protein
MKRPFLLWKRGQVWYYKLPDIKHYLSTGQTTRRAAENYVVDIFNLVCPKCGSEMKVVAVITVPSEVNKIFECLKRNNAPPFDKVEIKAS